MSSKLIGFFQSIAGKADSVLTTKADLATYSTARTRLGVGSNDTVLTADSSEATGLKWAASGGISSPLTSDLVVNDNINIKFGTGSDATIDYDGTNLIINPKAVGSVTVNNSGVYGTTASGRGIAKTESFLPATLGSDGTTLTWTAPEALDLNDTYQAIVVIIRGWTATASSWGIKLNDHTDYDCNRIMNDQTTLTGAHLDANANFELVNSSISTNGDSVNIIATISLIQAGTGGYHFGINSVGSVTYQGNQQTDGTDVTSPTNQELDKIELVAGSNMDSNTKMKVYGILY